MGIYVKVFKKQVKRSHYYKFLRNLTRDITRFLHIKGYIASNHLRISLIAIREKEAKYDEEIRCDPATAMKVIKDLGIKFNHESVSFQVAGILRLSNPSTRKPYLANFEIFLPGNNYLREDYGDLMFDIGGASEEFKGETEYGFNAFFSPGDFNKPNRIMLERILKILRQRNYPRRQIQKINVGEHAMPFARMQSCLYIWRPSYEIFQGDLIKCFELIRKDAEDDSLLLSPEVQTKFQARWDRARDFLSIFEHPFLQEQLRLLNQENTLITDYFNEVAATEEGSFILHHKQVTSYRPLYPVLESFHAKLTEAFAKALNFSPENLWELIAKNW